MQSHLSRSSQLTPQRSASPSLLPLTPSQSLVAELRAAPLVLLNPEFLERRVELLQEVLLLGEHGQ